MQASGRLVEDVEGLAGVGAGELGGELHALGLPAGERRRAWPAADVAEADVGRVCKTRRILGTLVKCSSAWVHGHPEHVGDRLAAERDRQGLAV